MSQRASGYPRKPNEAYYTPDWVAAIIARYLRERNIRTVWDPAAGNGQFAEALKTEGLLAVATGDDFFAYKRLPESIHGICSNPPYGDDRRGKLACDFIRHALKLAPTVAMLLRIDFDSALTRTGLFRDNPFFAGKIVLLSRIKWFPGTNGPSDNHCWMIWDRGHRGPPTIAYAEGPSKKKSF